MMDVNSFKAFLAEEINLDNYIFPKEDTVLVKAFFQEKKGSSEILLQKDGIFVPSNKEAYERTFFNYFKILSGPDKGQICSIIDTEINPPLKGMKHPEGNDMNKEPRPNWGEPGEKLLPYLYILDKLKGPELGTYMIPKMFINTIYKNPERIYEGLANI